MTTKILKNIAPSELEDLKIKVFEKILEVHKNLEALLKIKIPTIPVDFKLRGRVAGVYKLKSVGGVMVSQSINFNLFMLYNEKQHFIDNIVPHEYCHYVVSFVMGGPPKIKNYKPHGKEWANLMRLLKVEPDVCHKYKCLPKKAYKYSCRCSNPVIISALSHNKIMKYDGKIPKVKNVKGGMVKMLVSYKCSKCGTKLDNSVPSEEVYV